MKEVWFIGNLTEMFKETVTNISMGVLQSELAICKELLSLEPDNKCEFKLIKCVYMNYSIAGYFVWS